MGILVNAIKIDIKIDAPIEKVWEAWTNPYIILNWFGSDPNGQVLKARLDVYPGGNFEIAFRDSDLTEHVCYGVYSDVKEFTKLSFSWRWKSEPGTESFVKISLKPEGGCYNNEFRTQRFRE
jgi:uncharacterized protein YndB with AHSA1/START domain